MPAGSDHRLRREAAARLAALYKAVRRDLPYASFYVMSATRPFALQRYFWQGKWAKLSGWAPMARGRNILRWFAMPGTSRHHWGTDVDLVKTSNRYFTSGPGAALYRWLQQHAARFGFCQPYTAGRATGYREERWHWSYRPLARQYQKAWTRRFGKRPDAFLRHTGFPGAKTLAPQAATYVSGVDRSCL